MCFDFKENGFSLRTKYLVSRINIRNLWTTSTKSVFYLNDFSHNDWVESFTDLCSIPPMSFLVSFVVVLGDHFRDINGGGNQGPIPE